MYNLINFHTVKKRIFIVAAIVSCMFIAQSCVMQQAQKIVVHLSAVESPENAKVQFGKRKVLTFNDGDKQECRYVDDYINIVWIVDYEGFGFSLTNKTDYTIKINWDDISYIDITGNVRRVMHSGVKNIDKSNSQPATSIPRKATITDLLLPADNVYYESGKYGGWRIEPLIPDTTYSSGGAEGKTMTILMPIMIENVQNDYIFEFVIINAKPEAKHKRQSQYNDYLW